MEAKATGCCCFVIWRDCYGLSTRPHVVYLEARLVLGNDFHMRAASRIMRPCIGKTFVVASKFAKLVFIYPLKPPQLPCSKPTQPGKLAMFVQDMFGKSSDQWIPIGNFPQLVKFPEDIPYGLLLRSDHISNHSILNHPSNFTMFSEV